MTFVRVADRLSLSAAGKDLGITPQSVVAALNALEKNLGITLLDRHARGVALTDDGRRFLDAVRPGIAIIESALEFSSSNQIAASGRLRMGVTPFAFIALAEPLFVGFSRHNSSIFLEIDVGHLEGDLRGYDACIQESASDFGPELSIRVSGGDRFAVAASPTYFATATVPEHPTDLMAHRCIVSKSPFDSESKWQFHDGDARISLSVPRSFAVNEISAMKSAAMAGAGIIYSVESAIRAEIETGKLISILEDYCPAFPGFFLAPTGPLGLSDRLKTFLDYSQMVMSSA